ncbi:hypothetical protein PENANT_c027G04838 [Penicillium antarcticum]|uniref:Uncharacterized protein n=1 Tax=Penicillium antarcticum TaxID=416450 RepID=A0A1V6PWN7_9EURO|nr:hypothetical protein PENANT_c027G04838 [Penicillium antarcticum]
MTSGLVRPLAVVCIQSQSQRHIKAVRNLGDAWQSYADQPPESDDKSTGPDDLRSEEEDCMLEPQEVLSSYPPSSWNYMDVAWNVAGLMLAWRIAMAPQVGRIEFSTGDSKYFTEKGKETSVTSVFLQEQADIVAKGMSVSKQRGTCVATDI